MKLLPHIFNLVCGQVHRWTVGGQSLPFCERCTGLYVGGVISLIAIVLFRPRPTRFWLWCHGTCLLLMIPFGYHLIPQNPPLRTVTGEIFSVGMTYFLLLTPLGFLNHHVGVIQRPAWPYVATIVAGIPLLLTLIQFGGATASIVLSWIGFLGLTLYAALCLANLVVIPAAIWASVSHKQNTI